MERRRTLCLIGFAYLTAQLLAGFLPSVAFGPLTAVFILLFASAVALRHRGKALLIALLCISAAAALSMRLLYLNRVVEPVLSFAGESGIIEADVLETRTGFGEERVYATVRVRVWNGQALARPFQTEIEACPQTEPGRAIRAQVEFSSLPENEYRSNSQAKGRFIAAEYQSGFLDLGAATGIRNKLLRFQMQLRDSLYKILPAPYRELASAMCIGDKSGLASQQKELFQQTGLSHVLVVSGLHLSAVGGLCYVGMKRLVNRRAAAAISCLAVLIFMALVDFTPSVVRAGCVMLLIYLGKLLRQPGDVLTSMGVAALLLCFQNPFASQDMGLLLSFSATLAVLFAEKVMERIREQWEEKERRFSKTIVRIYQTALVTVLVTLATMPAIAAMGGGVSLLAVLCNVLVLPVLPAVVVSGLLCAMTGLFSPLFFAAKFFGLVCALCIRWMLWITNIASSVSWSMIYVSGAYAVLASLCAIALILLAWNLGFSLRKGLSTALCLAISAVLIYQAGTLHVVRFTLVGSGLNPSLVVTQAGYTLVVYRSPQSNAQQIAEYLQTQNRTKIDFLLDLRQEGDTAELALTLNAAECLSVQELNNHAVKTLFRDIMIYVKRQENGNFVCVDVGGRRLATACGSADFSAYPPVNVYFGGSGTPQGLLCEEVVLPAAGTHEWAQAYPEVYQGRSEQQVWVRAGGGIKVEEVRDGFE